MAKDSEDEIARKRKKVDVSETNGKGTTDDSGGSKSEATETEKSQNSGSVYQRLTEYEENELLARDPDKDLVLYKETCADFATQINEITELKMNKPDGWEENVQEKKIEGSLLLVIMKKLNRFEKMRNKIPRENVIKAKQQVDVLQLQLDNLMCEIQRLQKEIDKCLACKSKPLGIDLVSVDEFFSQAPARISRPEITKFDEHQLQLARLEWELDQRKELSLLSSKLEEKKNNLSKTIQKKKHDLDSLSPLIKDVLNVTKPMQDKLGLPSSSLSSKHESAHLLPHTLYFLFEQASAYRKAWDKRINVEIVGDTDKANLLKNASDESSSDDDSDNEEPSKNQKKEKKEKIESRRKELLAKHPLSVIMTINLNDGSSIALEFFYLLKLNIITVQPTLTLPTKLKSSAASTLLQNNNILTNLFPGDTGEDSPNVANYYQLKEAGIENLDHKKIGLPYLWVQKLGGLDFAGTSVKKRVEPKQEIAKTSLPSITKEICRRIKSRIALVKQVMELESGHIVGPPEMKCVKLSCSLKNWEVFSWNDYQNHPATSHLKDTQYISPHDMFFKGTITREQAKLSVFMSVKCNYPASTPVCALQIEWNGNVWNCTNNSKTMEIEREVNSFWEGLVTKRGWANTFLTYQIHRIMVCFDIMLECASPEQFVAEKKMFFHPFRGRNRMHPYEFVPMGEGVFLHRTCSS